MLLSFCLFSAQRLEKTMATAGGCGQGKPALPNYLPRYENHLLDASPAGSLSIGFSTPSAAIDAGEPFFAPSPYLTLQPQHLGRPAPDRRCSTISSRSMAASAAVRHRRAPDPSDGFHDLQLYRRIQADIYQQNGGMFPTITVQSNVSRSIRDAAVADDSTIRSSEARTTHWSMRREACSREAYEPECCVDSPLARVSPGVMGYVGGYYQWDNNWKLTGRFGVQSFGRRAASEPDAVSRLHAADPCGSTSDRMDDDDNRLFGITAQIAWTPKPSLPANAANAALRDQELAGKLPDAPAALMRAANPALPRHAAACRISGLRRRLSGAGI